MLFAHREARGEESRARPREHWTAMTLDWAYVPGRSFTETRGVRILRKFLAASVSNKDPDLLTAEVKSLREAGEEREGGSRSPAPTPAGEALLEAVARGTFRG